MMHLFMILDPHTHMHQSQGWRIIDMCIIHACIRIKDHMHHMHQGYMYHGYMHDGYMYHGYMHHSIMHHGYMHHRFMHHGYMHHGYMHHQQSESRIYALWTPSFMDTAAWVTRPERPKGAKDEVK